MLIFMSMLGITAGLTCGKLGNCDCVNIGRSARATCLIEKGQGWPFFPPDVRSRIGLTISVDITIDNVESSKFIDSMDQVVGYKHAILLTGKNGCKLMDEVRATAREYGVKFTCEKVS